MDQVGGKLWVLAREPEGPLVAYLDSFAEWLDSEGFKRHLIGRQIRVVAYFSRWLESKEIGVETMTEDHARQFLCEPDQRGTVEQCGAATLRRLVGFLRRMGVSPPPIASRVPTPIELIIAAYAAHLQQDQCLSPKTLVQYCPVAEAFLSERFGTGPVDLSAVRGVDVIEFMLRQAARLKPVRAKVTVNALRSFLRYVRYCGGTQLDLAGTVPTVANWSMPAIPRAIAPDHLRTVLASCRRDTPIGRRDYAILMLLARLGLRSSEIVSLTLDSISWETGSIAIAGKGSQPAVLPLPAEVGEAIVQYLQGGRPACECRALFLRANAPIRGLGSQATIGTIVRAAITRAGVETQHHGAHQFRHALAADMLRKGATLTEIGSLLRHRHPKTTGIYAKVDFEALRPLSLPWPGGAA